MGKFLIYFRPINKPFFCIKSKIDFFDAFYSLRDDKRCQLCRSRASIPHSPNGGLFDPATMQSFLSSQSFTNELRLPASAHGVQSYGMVCLLHR
jgi:hypothetical protein